MSLNPTLTRLDHMICDLLEHRAGIVEELVNELPPVVNSAFVVPLKSEGRFQAAAYDQFAPNIMLGFQQSEKSAIFVEQVKKTDPVLSPPDHNYMLSVSLDNVATSPWVSLERILPPSLSGQMRLTVALNAMVSAPCHIRVALILPQKGKGPKLHALGTVDITKVGKFTHECISGEIDLRNVEIPDGFPPKLALFLPERNGLKLTFAMFSLFFSDI